MSSWPRSIRCLIASRVPPSQSVAIEVVDTVGAGDCSLAGLLSSRMKHPERGWDAHLRAAVAAGTGACLSAGATPPSDDLLERLAGTIRVSEG